MTSNAIERATDQGIQVIDANTVRRFICANATDNEIGLFIEIAKAYELNPFKREIYLVKYGSYPASVIVGYETYLKRAERTGVLDGWDVAIEGEPPDASATITIYRKDRSHPIKWTAYYVDAVQYTKDGAPTQIWRKWKFMLRKVAIAQGMRLAFPDELGGMPYTEEEIDPRQPPAAREVVIDSAPLAEKIRGALPQATGEDTSDPAGPCTAEDRRRLFGVCKAAGYTEEDVRAATCRILQVPDGSTKNLTVGQVNTLCTMAEAKELLTEPEGAKPREAAQAAQGAASGGAQPSEGGPTGSAASGAPSASSGVASSRGALGRYVRQMREEAGVTAESMAGALGLEPVMVQKLEAGEVLFTEATATAAAKFLALDPADLLAIGGLEAGERGKGKGTQKGLFGKVVK